MQMIGHEQQTQIGRILKGKKQCAKVPTENREEINVERLGSPNRVKRNRAKRKKRLKRRQGTEGNKVMFCIPRERKRISSNHHHGH